MNKVLVYFVLSILIAKVFNDTCSSKNEVADIEDSQCRQLEITENPSEQYICIKNTDTPESTGCKEEKLCQFQGEKDDCSGYPTAIGYKCMKNVEGNCVTEQIICGEEGVGKGSSDLCPLLKVNDDDGHKACVKDKNEAKCIVATDCEDVEVDATEDLCEKFNVENGKKCLKEGVACVVKTICDGAAGTNDDDCQNFWVTDSNSKRCAKKDGEDKCEEVLKAEEEQPNPTPNTQATEAQPTQQQTPNPTPTPTSEASQNTQATQNTQTTQNSQTTSSDTTSSTTKATKSSNLSSADGIKMSLMSLIIMFVL